MACLSPPATGWIFHEMVNHLLNVADPTSVVHTQNIECIWSKGPRRDRRGPMGIATNYLQTICRNTRISPIHFHQEGILITTINQDVYISTLESPNIIIVPSTAFTATSGSSKDRTILTSAVRSHLRGDPLNFKIAPAFS